MFCKRNITQKNTKACGVTSRVRLQKHSRFQMGQCPCTRELEKPKLFVLSEKNEVRLSFSLRLND